MSSVPDSVTAWVRENRAFAVIVAVTVGALVFRLVGLGARVMHWDEGRVGYWILRYAESGLWEYRYIVHGPFLFHVNDYVFAFLGPSDFSARLVVALVGGLLPLSAWLFREHLDGFEMAALAGFLALNPLLVYYSRFMRNDLLVAGFMFVSFGLFVRAYDTKRARYLYPAVGAFALAFTAKESAIIYPVTWLGASVLLLDHRLFSRSIRSKIAAPSIDARDTGPEKPFAITEAYVRRLASTLWRWRIHVVANVVLFLFVIVVFYAPRTGGTGVGLDAVLSNPSVAPAVVEEALVGSWKEFYGGWVGGDHQDHAYLPFLGAYLKSLASGAPALIVLAVVGFVLDRYRHTGPRDVVAFTSYWGFVSILGYPLAMDIKAPWATVNALVPLAIPAAVGIAVLVRWSIEASRDEDYVSTALGVVLVVLVVGSMTATAVQVGHLKTVDPDNDTINQWAQPHNDVKPTIEKAMAIAQRNDGVDVMFYGSKKAGKDEVRFFLVNEDDALQPTVGRYNEDAWHDRLPLPWYFEKADANVSSVRESNPDPLRDPAPVVIAVRQDASDLEPYLDGYTRYEHELRLWDKPVVFFIDER